MKALLTPKIIYLSILLMLFISFLNREGKFINQNLYYAIAIIVIIWALIVSYLEISKIIKRKN